VTRERTHVWYDGAWPVLAGLVAGAGLVAAYRWTGPVTFLVALAVLELTVAPVAWSLLIEAGYSVRRVVLRVAPMTAVALLAVIGLAESIGGWTYLVVAFLLASSPLLRGWSSGGVRGVVAGWATPHVRTRREFDEIVAHSLSTPDDELPR
jgi:hypothetical protein